MMAENSPSVLAEVFAFGDMEYYAGIELFHRVLERLDVKMPKSVVKNECCGRIEEMEFSKKVQKQILEEA